MRIADHSVKSYADAVSDFDLFDKNGRKVGAVISMHSADSDVGRAAWSLASRRNIQEAGKNPNRSDVEIEMAAKRHIAWFLSQLAEGWTLEDEFSRENVERLILEWPWIADALDSFVAIESNFFTKASAVSVNTPGRGRGSKGQREKVAA